MVREERENTFSTIRSSACSTDCRPIVLGMLLPVWGRWLSAWRVPCWAALQELVTFRSSLGRVAKWQTRWLQVPVFERMWGFKSPLAHEQAPLRRGLVSFWGRVPAWLRLP